MKKLVIIFATLLITGTNIAQNLEGKWTGLLEIQNLELRVIFNISQNGNSYSATMDSPDQGAKGIPIDSVWVEDNTFRFKLESQKMSYKGKISDDCKVIDGSLNQMGTIIPIQLTLQEDEVENNNRYQTPVAPFPYKVEEVTFENTRDSITLAGTLTLPEEGTSFPAVILISGSGPQNRDEEVFDHKPFLVLADALTKNGLAVLRFDDRGVGESTGSFKVATTADFATDVSYAIEYLSGRDDINASEIGLLGHSEGGLIAPMVASDRNDVAFVILMAGPGVPSDELLIQQSIRSAQLSGVSEEFIKLNSDLQAGIFEIIKQNSRSDSLADLLKTYLTEGMVNIPDEYKPPTEEGIQSIIDGQIKSVTNDWFKYFISLNPQTYLEELSIPVLALNGSLDCQVLANENLEGIEKSLQKAGNKSYKIIEFPGLNHLFQEAKSGAVSEYNQIEQTLAPIMIESLTTWILDTLN